MFKYFVFMALVGATASVALGSPAQRPDDTGDVRLASVGIGRAHEPGRLLVEHRCAKCHAVGRTGVSRYPGAQPFRNFGKRWTREKLTQALHTGILAEHDSSGVRFEMRLSDQEIADFFNYLDSISTRSHPAPG